ncbi:slightly ste11-like protein [Coemansia spiralis]|nr:slightly ste11-like protein [Coemansia spiralis]
MNQYPGAYQKYGGGSPPRSQSFMPVAYATMGGLPAMGGMAQHPVSHTMQPYAFMSPTTQAPPQYAHPAQQPMSVLGRGPTMSSRVALEPSCVVYMCDASGAMPRPHVAQQVVLADGKVYIEHIPGHNIIFTPSSTTPAAAAAVAAQQVSGSRVSKGRGRGAAMAKPSNVFFKYRSVKQRELQEAHPRLNQTVISRMVAEHWRVEPTEVKDKFRNIYKEEMRQYELSKRVRRPRTEDAYTDAEDPTSGASTLRQSSEIQTLVHEPAALGIHPGHHAALMGTPQRPRSFTLPADTAQQLGISRLID